MKNRIWTVVHKVANLSRNKMGECFRNYRIMVVESTVKLFMTTQRGLRNYQKQSVYRDHPGMTELKYTTLFKEITSSMESFKTGYYMNGIYDVYSLHTLTSTFLYQTLFLHLIYAIFFCLFSNQPCCLSWH